MFPAADRFGIVCFRPHEDGFFTVTVARGQLNSDAHGRLTAFKGGVADADDTVPVSRFVGRWQTRQAGADAVFVAKAEDAINAGARVEIDDSSVTVVKPFKSTNGADVDYQLSIQLSTGRFAERHVIHNGRTVESSGRCMPIPASTKQ